MSRFEIWGKEHANNNVAVLDEKGAPTGAHKTVRATDAKGKPLIVKNGLLDTQKSTWENTKAKLLAGGWKFLSDAGDDQAEAVKLHEQLTGGDSWRGITA